MNDAITKAILNHESQDVGIVAKDVGRDFGQFIPRSYVMKVLGKNKRAFSVSNAKDRASDALDDKVSLMEDVVANLLKQFAEPSLSTTERMKVSQELRQWTKMSLDVAGIHDEEGDQLWVIDSDWDTRPAETLN